MDRSKPWLGHGLACVTWEVCYRVCFATEEQLRSWFRHDFLSSYCLKVVLFTLDRLGTLVSVSLCSDTDIASLFYYCTIIREKQIISCIFVLIDSMAFMRTQPYCTGRGVASVLPRLGTKQVITARVRYQLLKGHEATKQPSKLQIRLGMASVLWARKAFSNTPGKSWKNKPSWYLLQVLANISRSTLGASGFASLWPCHDIVAQELRVFSVKTVAFKRGGSQSERICTKANDR